MFILDQPAPSGPDLLVEIGLDTQAIQQILFSDPSGDARDDE